jgi:hypothetical protein
MIKKNLLESPTIMDFLEGREEDIQIYRFSDIDPEVLPLILIGTPEEKSTTLTDDPPAYRNHITLTVDVFCPVKEADILDDITFEIRNRLAEIVFARGTFEPLKHDRTVTASYQAGTKLVAASASEYSTFIDLEYNKDHTYPLFERMLVNGSVHQPHD